MKKSIFSKPLERPSKGEKVYELSIGQKQEILGLRGLNTELDPGMGGVSPEVLEDLLDAQGSELVSVDLALTAACNFRCAHCYKPGEEWGKLILSFDRISEVIEESAELGVRFFVLTGGEPTLYRDGNRDIFSVIDKIHQIYGAHGIEPHVLTFSDVAPITPTKAQKFAERKVALCLKRDTLEHTTQDSIVAVKGGSEKMEIGYQNLFNAGYGSYPDLIASVNHVLRKGEFDTLSGAIDLHNWVVSHGMHHSIVPIHYCGDAIDEEQESGIHPLEVKALYDILSSIDATKFGSKWEVYSAFPMNKSCNRPGRGVHIRVTGKVTACSESPLVDEYVFGNVNDESLVEMISSERFQKFKGEFAEREGRYICNPQACDLNAYHLCRGGCATRSAYSVISPETGLIEQNPNLLAYTQGREDPLCPGWMVLAQQQGVLKEGLYAQIVDDLLSKSNLEPQLAVQVRTKVIGDFEALKKNNQKSNLVQ